MRYASVLFSLVMAFTGCRKYDKLKPLKQPCYIRVFNDIATKPSVLNNGNLNTFTTFLVDPAFDKLNSPSNALITADYLLTRQLYNVSYPTNAANTVAGSGTVNYEYPGRSHVITAPPMNGFDLSSWAEMPSGQHRIIFISRPAGDTPFDSLTSVQRSHVLVDTTLDFQAGEVYTIEAVARDIKADTYGAYVRKEEFVHRQYSADSLYTAFFNLNAHVDPADINFFSSYFDWFKDSMTVTATYNVFKYPFMQYDPLDGYTNVQIPLNDQFSPTGKDLVLPALDSSYFFDLQGNPGSSPYVSLVIGPLNSNGQSNTQYAVNFSENPVGFNLKYPTSSAPISLGGSTSGELLPNLNLIETIGKKVSVYPTLNIVELANNKVYLTQIQKGIAHISNN